MDRFVLSPLLTVVSFKLGQVFLIGILGTALFLFWTNISASGFDLKGYQRPDGAITVHKDGDRIDPYFATKALLVANRLGMDIDTVAREWIAWLMPRQNEPGLFNRYCIRDNQYVPCERADADDAMLAVWIELLLTVTAQPGMEKKWIQSWRRSKDYLSTVLYDSHRGVYHISRSKKVALLMDNVEVYEALQAIAGYYQQQGDRGRAIVANNRAFKLKENIMKNFWNEKAQRYEVSTQNIGHESFYPARTAQLYPMMAGISVPEIDDRRFFNNWLRVNKDAWFSAVTHDYPWGLLLLAARVANVNDVQRQWLDNSKEYRHGIHWNVLEEAVYQGITQSEP